jgi:hypothetical protein
MDEDTPSFYPCPLCQEPVRMDYDCPGYGTNSGIMVCSPPCGGAIEYYCAAGECEWWYREPSNRGDHDTMGVKPEWLDAAMAEYQPTEGEGDADPFFACAQEATGEKNG